MKVTGKIKDIQKVPNKEGFYYIVLAKTRKKKKIEVCIFCGGHVAASIDTGMYFSGMSVNIQVYLRSSFFKEKWYSSIIAISIEEKKAKPKFVPEDQLPDKPLDIFGENDYNQDK